MEQTPATPAALGEAIIEARRSDNPAEVFESLRAALQPVIDAFRALAVAAWKTISALIERLMPALLALKSSFAAGLAPSQIETAYRRYAERLNAGRRTRKVSWRRLNRPQRARALELYMFECWSQL